MLLEQFDLLRNQNPQKRLAATLKIFEHLKLADIPPAHIDNLGTLKEHYGEEVHYTYTRLTRGLASNREAARLGFSACLSELLRALPLIDLSFILASVERATTPVGNVKGQETRDYQFGRLFGLQAIVTSGLLTRKETSKEQVRELLGLLFELSLTKGWLRESCASVLIQILNQLHGAAQGNGQSKPSKSLAKMSKRTSEMVHEMLYTTELSETIEGIAIRLKCAEVGFKKEAAGSEDDKRILSAERLPALANIMLEQNTKDKVETEESEEVDAKATGTWKPKLHFAWAVIIKAIVAGEQDANSETVPFARFWRQLVDEAMFSQNASHERKFHGLQLLPTALALVQKEDAIAHLFSPNLMRTLINQISQEDRYLYKAARNTAQQVVAICEAQPHKAFPVICALMDSSKGALLFDRLSKTKTCEQIMLAVPDAQFPELIAHLIKQCQKPLAATAETKEVGRARQYVADVLISLLKSNKTSKEETTVMPVLQLFITAGLFTPTSSKKLAYTFEPELSEVSMDAFKARISIALGHLLPSKTSTHTELYAAKAVQHIASLANGKRYTLRLAPDEQITGLLQTAQGHLEQIAASVSKSSKAAQDSQDLAFSLLYSLSILHVYLGEADGVELLEELEAAYASLTSGEAAVSSDVHGQAMQILIDLLLALLSKESVLLRKLVETVFSAFAGQLQREDLQLLLNVLEAQDTGEGLFDKDQEEDENEDDEDGDEDEEHKHDDDDEEQDEENGSNADDDESMEDDDSQTGDEQTEADRELDAALVAALGPAAQQKRKADALESDEDDSSDEELMDDDAMLKMDAHLENIFKRRKSASEAHTAKRQDAKHIKQSTIQLKSKVLDLLDVFVRENVGSSLVVYCCLPVLYAAKSTSDTALADKARNLVKQKLTKQKVLPKPDADIAEEIWAMLKQVHRLAGVSPTPPFASMASQCSVFLAKVLLGMHDERELVKAKLIEQYAASQLHWMTKKRSSFGAAFFTDFTNWCAQYRQK